MEKGHQYKGCRREVLKITCAGADGGPCKHKETKLTVCTSWDDSALEDRGLKKFFLSFGKSWGNNQKHILCHCWRKTEQVNTDGAGEGGC